MSESHKYKHFLENTAKYWSQVSTYDSCPDYMLPGIISRLIQKDPYNAIKQAYLISEFTKVRAFTSIEARDAYMSSFIYLDISETLKITHPIEIIHTINKIEDSFRKKIREAHQNAPSIFKKIHADMIFQRSFIKPWEINIAPFKDDINTTLKIKIIPKEYTNKKINFSAQILDTFSKDFFDIVIHRYENKIENIVISPRKENDTLEKSIIYEEKIEENLRNNKEIKRFIESCFIKDRYILGNLPANDSIYQIFEFLNKLKTDIQEEIELQAQSNLSQKYNMIKKDKKVTIDFASDIESLIKDKIKLSLENLSIEDVEKVKRLEEKIEQTLPLSQKSHSVAAFRLQEIYRKNLPETISHYQKQDNKSPQIQERFKNSLMTLEKIIDNNIKIIEYENNTNDVEINQKFLETLLEQSEQELESIRSNLNYQEQGR